MNKHFQKVLKKLKTRKEVKALGFSRKELKGIAANVADKLELKDDASDDEISDAIDDAIDSIVPYLEIVNSSADRRIDSYKLAHPSKDDDDDDDPVETPAPKANKKDAKKDGKGEGESKGDEDNPLLAAIKQLTDTVKGMQGEIATLKTNRTADTRRSKVEEILKDSGKFGERAMKAFNRMTFKDDDEFDDYLDELKGDLEEVNKERTKNGLDTLGHIPNGGNPKPKETEVLSAEQVKELAKL